MPAAQLFWPSVCDSLAKIRSVSVGKPKLTVSVCDGTVKSDRMRRKIIENSAAPPRKLSSQVTQLVIEGIKLQQVELATSEEGRLVL